jgi:hypothetical protein
MTLKPSIHNQNGARASGARSVVGPELGGAPGRAAEDPPALRLRNSFRKGSAHGVSRFQGNSAPHRLTMEPAQNSQTT